MDTSFLLKKGAVLFEEGSTSDCAFIVESGLLEVSKTGKDGKQEFIGVVHAADIVGELGLIDGLPRSATVSALENTRVTIISRDQFKSLSKNNPQALIPILKILAARLRNSLRLVQKLSSHSETPDA